MSSTDLSKIRVAWIDLDDTLIDFKANSRAALTRLWLERRFSRLWATPEEWIEAYEHHNIPLWVDYSVGLISVETLRAERFRRPLTDAGMSNEDALQLYPALDKEYLDYMAMEKRLIPGAMELLLHLKEKGLTIGILSNGFADVQHRKIENAGLAPLIDITVLSDDIGINKPDTRLFRHAQSRTMWPHDPGAHLMIGDNPATDIGGAASAGWSAIWYNPRGSEAGLPPGVMSVSSLCEIPELLS